MPVKDQTAPKAGGKKPDPKAVERNDKRIHVALPIRITFWDKDKKPGLEMACTYDISSRGARVANVRCVKEKGEIVTLERGRNKAFCRVVWIGAPNSEFKGQIGLQCLESERAIFESELKELEDAYDSIPKESKKSRAETDKDNRRQEERYAINGMAEIMKNGAKSGTKVTLKDLSEMGCKVVTKEVLVPGTDIKLVLQIANYALNVKGKVKHSAKDLSIGIEFNEIRKGDRDMLKHLIKKLEEKDLESAFQIGS